MEQSEAPEGFSFHKEPLEVEDGVAATEEGVELHVPDVVTQTTTMMDGAMMRGNEVGVHEANGNRDSVPPVKVTQLVWR